MLVLLILSIYNMQTLSYFKLILHFPVFDSDFYRYLFAYASNQLKILNCVCFISLLYRFKFMKIIFSNEHSQFLNEINKHLTDYYIYIRNL